MVIHIKVDNDFVYIWQKPFLYISLSLVRMIHLLNPPKIYLWGELTKLGDFLLSNLYAGISHSSIYQERENTVLEIVRFEGNTVFQGLARMKLYQEYIGQL